MIEHLRNIHRIDKDGPMDTQGAVTQRIDKVFGKAKQRLEFNHEIFKHLLLRWVIINHIAFRQVEDHAFRTMLCYLLACIS